MIMKVNISLSIYLFPLLFFPPSSLTPLSLALSLSFPLPLSHSLSIYLSIYFHPPSFSLSSPPFASIYQPSSRFIPSPSSSSSPLPVSSSASLFTHFFLIFRMSSFPPFWNDQSSDFISLKFGEELPVVFLLMRFCKFNRLW